MKIDLFRNELKECLVEKHSLIMIESFDLSSISNMLLSLVEETDTCKCDEILEWNPGVGQTRFNSDDSEATYCDLSNILLDFLHEDTSSILILKNIQEVLHKDNKSLSLLQSFIFKNDQKQRSKRSIIIIIDAIYHPPVELEKLFYRLTFPYPDRQDIHKELEKYNLKGRLCNKLKKNECVNALIGMHMYEIKNILKKRQEKNGGIWSRDIYEFAKYKEQIVKNSGVLEIIDTSNYSINDIGGLDSLKKYLKRKSLLFKNPTLRIERNLPPPKGILLIGHPGCGKSITAKAIATIFNVPLLRLDMGQLMGSYLGESEHNLSKAISVAESAQPCVLWIDEIEKAFAGSVLDSNSKSDVTVRRMMGKFLTWLQEHDSEVYIAATANELALPPELTRKGRFDDVFFVGLPSQEERKKIFEISLRRHKFDTTPISLDTLAGSLEVSYTGAEINAIVHSACEDFIINQRFDNNEEYTISDALTAVMDEDHSKYKDLKDIDIKERKKLKELHKNILFASK